MGAILLPTRSNMNPDLYIRVREKEGRLYTDDIVRYLPSFPSSHPLTEEWKARAASAKRLCRYLARLPRPLTILDLGCGNGWLSNHLTESGHQVMGLDQNQFELKQAARVFRNNSNLLFLEADIFSSPFENPSFDIIILASSIQYFSDLPVLFKTLCNFLKPNGEIHVMDSPLYRDEDVKSAAQRSREYYADIGFPEMADFYFHHAFSALDTFHPIVLYQPNPGLLRLKHRFRKLDSPFPWVCIRK